MEFQNLLMDYGMYGVLQSPDGRLFYNNTRDFLDQKLEKEEQEPIKSEFISKSLSVTKALKGLEEKTQGVKGVNPAIKQPQSVGGRVFKVKPIRYSKYM